jgi:hypothetical protein
MTSEELVAALIEHAKTIAPGATVIVYADAAKHDKEAPSAIDIANADHWDLADAIHWLTDWLAAGVDEAFETGLQLDPVDEDVEAADKPS